MAPLTAGLRLAWVFMLAALLWGGLQFWRQADALLRQQQVSALQMLAQAGAQQLARDVDLLDYLGQSRWQEDARRQLFLPLLPRAPVLDGYADDWRALPSAPRHFSRAVDAPRSLRVYPGRHDDTIYLYVESGLAATELRLYCAGMEYVVRGRAAAEVAVFRRTPAGAEISEPRVRAVWQPLEEGFAVELKLPAELAGGHLGLVVTGRAGEWLGNQGPGQYPPTLVQSLEPLPSALTVLARDDLRVHLLSRNGWHLGAAGSLPGRREIEASQSTWRRLAAALVFDRALPEATELAVAGWGQLPEAARALAGQPGLRWYRWRQQRLARLAVPVTDADGRVLAVLLLEQGRVHLLPAMDAVLTRLFLWLATLALLLTAIILLWRRRRLQRLRALASAAAASHDRSGRLRGSLPGTADRDEVGELARSYSELLQRLESQRDYLQTLAGKLSHELRTPLAIMRSSLDNLELEQDPQARRRILQRARDGGARMAAILSAMSAANRVEESIRQARCRHFDLAALLTQLHAAYVQVHGEREILLRLEAGDCGRFFYGCPDLVAQMVDKLMDNAVDFCGGGRIELRLQRRDGNLLLSVGNDGPLLPPHLQEALFESLVSARPAGGSGVHLGLGLYIVRLIAEFHRARVRAANRADAGGVEFEVLFYDPPAG